MHTERDEREIDDAHQGQHFQRISGEKARDKNDAAKERHDPFARDT